MQFQRFLSLKKKKEKKHILGAPKFSLLLLWVWKAVGTDPILQYEVRLVRLQVNPQRAIFKGNGLAVKEASSNPSHP